MPHSDLHKQKRKKNLAMLAMIAAFCIILCAVTVIRISGG